MALPSPQSSIPEQIMFDPTLSLGGTMPDERNRRKLSQIRVVTRIRPLVKDEEGCQVCIHPVMPAKEFGASLPKEVDGKVRSPNHRGSILSSISPHRRKPATTQPRQPPTQNSPMHRHDSLPNAKRNRSLHRQQSQPHNIYSLIAGTENKMRFDFDAVLGPAATQNETYEHCLGDTIRQNISRGTNTTIVAVGQDRSGKSYTMSGGWKFNKTPKNHESSISSLTGDAGILPRAVHEIFQAKQCHELAGDVEVTMSFLEISDDGLRDLIAECQGVTLPTMSRQKDCDVITAETCLWETVDSASEVRRVMDRATKERTKDSTARRGSHLFCSFQVTTTPHTRGKSEAENSLRKESTTRLTFVSLSGPDIPTCIDHSALQDDEDMYNLKGILLALGRSSENRPHSSSHSEDILHQILEDAFDGEDGFTILIACVSPADSKVEASLDILRLAAMATKAKNSMKRTFNKPHQIEASELEAVLVENRMLKDQVRRLEAEREDASDERVIKNGDISDLQQTMKHAEEAAKNARESSRSFEAAAARWRSHRRRRSEATQVLPITKVGRDEEVLEASQDKEHATAFSDTPHGRQSDTFDKPSEHQNEGRRARRHGPRLLRENEELRTNIDALQTAHSKQQETIETLEHKLSHHTMQLTEERLVTEKLESNRESFKKVAFLQDERIHDLKEELEEALQANENLQHELTGMNFILKGERRLKEQAQELQALIEKNYGILSEELNKENPCHVSYQKGTEKLHLSEGQNPINSPTNRAEDTSSSEKNLALRACSLDTFGRKKLLTVLDDSGVSESSIYFDAGDAGSEDCGEEPIVEMIEIQQKPVKVQREATKSPFRALRTIQNSGNSSISSGSPHGLLDKENSRSAPTKDGRKDESPTGNSFKVDRSANYSCQPSLLSPHSVEGADFYLPNVDAASICGKKQVISGNEQQDVSDLRSILRPWQSEFLASVGIFEVHDFLKAYEKSASTLVKFMRQWRKEKNLPSMKSKSCAIALLIWSRTCSTIVQSRASQRASFAPSPI